MNQDKPKRMFPDFKDYCNHSRIERMKDQEKKEAMNQDKQIVEKRSAEYLKKIILQSGYDEIDLECIETYVDLRIMETLDQFQNPPPIKCTCERTGETEMLVMCCNICGKPDDGAIGRIGTPAILLSEVEKQKDIYITELIALLNELHNYQYLGEKLSERASEFLNTNSANDYFRKIKTVKY